MTILLRSHGHSVTSFASAEAYLAQDVEAHCAILDIALPGISGLELVERMTLSGRLVPVVFITAHVESAVMAAVQRTRRPLLRKPLIEDDLLEAIARATSE